MGGEPDLNETTKNGACAAPFGFGRVTELFA